MTSLSQFLPGHLIYQLNKSAVLLRASGAVVSLKEGGTPLGIMSGRDYVDTEAQLEAGDRLILYADETRLSLDCIT